MLNSAARKYTNENRFEQDQKLDNHLDTVCHHSSILDNVINKQGRWSLKAYLNSIQLNYDLAIQPTDDVINITYRYLNPLFGESIARAACIDLENFPVVLSANHHGVDYFSHSIQGSLLFFLAKQLKVKSFMTVPIFSCGNIPLNNPTYPRGLLLYRTFKNQIDTLPKKISIFPDRLKRTLVSFAPSFDDAMIKRAEKRLDNMVRKEQVCTSLLKPVLKILKEEYCRQSILDLSSYSQQAAVLNNAIWKRLFSTPNMAPHLVYMEIEKVVSELIKLDLWNTESLLWCTLFDTDVREQVIEELNGTKSCWNREKLSKRLSIESLDPSEKATLRGAGTIFFWGVDESGKQFPLYLMNTAKINAKLIGVDDHHRRWEFPFTRESILKLLDEKRLQPSLFISYLVISMARGISCIGGYFQSEYLPQMIKGVVNALRKIGGYDAITGILEKVNPNFYLSGMSAVMSSIDNKFLVPAGPAEIIAGDGLSERDIDQIYSLSVRDAHLASLYELLSDFTPWLLKTPEFKKRLAENSLNILQGKVVIK
jgi:hypothetical protein